MAELRETALAEKHRQMGAKMIEFAGWLMPVQYGKGIIKEHLCVRSGVGIFDVSHMGEFRIKGVGASGFVDGMVTNNVPREKGQVTYSPMCYADGGIVDDIMIYCLGEDDLMLVVNAANVEKDFRWLSEAAPSGVRVEDASRSTSLIAVQGPDAVPLVSAALGRELAAVNRFNHTEVDFCGERILASRTGYTGEDGFELYTSERLAPALWELLAVTGGPWSPEPVGLGARDTLRFEASYRLYGNDIDKSTNPLEAGLGWTVKFAKEDFLGKEALTKVKEEGPRRKFVGLELGTRRIARKDCPILAGGNRVGVVTSGGYAPYLEKSLAMGYVPADMAVAGTELEIELKGTRVPAVSARIPFLSGRDRPKTKG